MSSREGLGGVDELREAYKEKIRSLRHQSAILHAPPSPSSAQLAATSATPLTSPTSSPKSSSPPRTNSPAGIKRLSTYIDIPKVLELPPREIEYIWRLRHASCPHSLCAVIPSATYRQISETARRHPRFILPLPRQGQPAEIHFLQWTFPSADTSTILFTHLAEYKVRGEYSQPHTTVTHHLDLQGPKGLVLLQGTVIDGRGVSVDEGRWLLMCLQKFYAAGSDHAVTRKKLLEQFTAGDGAFDIETLLAEAEKT